MSGTRTLLHFSCEGIALTVWEFMKEPGEAGWDVRGGALFGQLAWTVWVGDVTTRELPVLGSRARMGT